MVQVCKTPLERYIREILLTYRVKCGNENARLKEIIGNIVELLQVLPAYLYLDLLPL